MTEDTENAVFKAQLDGTFVYEHIVVELNGASEYKVYLKRGDIDEDTIVCAIPHVHSLLTFLSLVTRKNPLFTSLADHVPTNVVKEC